MIVKCKCERLTEKRLTEIFNLNLFCYIIKQVNYSLKNGKNDIASYPADGKGLR